MNPQDTKPKQSSQRDIPNGNLSQNEDNTGFERNSSYVTIQPDSISGYNFDPQIRAQYANEPDYMLLVLSNLKNSILVQNLKLNMSKQNWITHILTCLRENM